MASERLGGLSAVGDEVRAGDERGPVGDEEADELGQLGRDADATEGIAGVDRLDGPAEAPGEGAAGLVAALRGDVAGRAGVDADPGRAELLREAGSIGDQRGLEIG